MNKNNLAKIIIILIALSGMVLLVWMISAGKKPNIQEPAPLVEIQKQKTTAITSLSEVIPVAAKEGEIPEGFPAAIPLNGKMNITESYSDKNSTTEDIVSSTVVFQSSKTLKENQTFYKKWAKDNKWQINKTEQNKIVSLFLVKENAFLTISLEELLNNTAKVIMVYKPAVVADVNKIKEQLRNIKL